MSTQYTTQTYMVSPGQPGYTQPTTVIVQTAPTLTAGLDQRYARQQSLGVGIVQILCGVLCIIANIVGIALSESANYYTTGIMYVSYGIWCGLFFLVSGALGIAANKTPTTGLVVGHMVMSIISACFCVVLLSIGSINAAVANGCTYNSYNSYYDSYLKCHTKIEYGLSILMLLLSLVEAFAAIWASAICCAAFCCRTQGTNTGTVLTGQVQTTTGATVINYPAQQAVGAYPQQPGGVTYPVPQQPGGVTYPVPQQPGGITYPVPQQPGGVGYPPQQSGQQQFNYAQPQYVQSTATNASAPPSYAEAPDNPPSYTEKV